LAGCSRDQHEQRDQIERNRNGDCGTRGKKLLIALCPVTWSGTTATPASAVAPDAKIKKWPLPQTNAVRKLVSMSCARQSK
jgi:hypothetical protein